uniref:Uncharacterized protein n=1 Tax=Anguilla anguilla TaxID=7936 RepID=A0A0E9WA20_ANGAN
MKKREACISPLVKFKSCLNAGASLRNAGKFSMNTVLLFKSKEDFSKYAPYASSQDVKSS